MRFSFEYTDNPCLVLSPRFCPHPQSRKIKSALTHTKLQHLVMLVLRTAKMADKTFGREILVHNPAALTLAIPVFSKAKAVVQKAENQP